MERETGKGKRKDLFKVIEVIEIDYLFGWLNTINVRQSIRPSVCLSICVFLRVFLTFSLFYLFLELNKINYWFVLSLLVFAFYYIVIFFCIVFHYLWYLTFFSVKYIFLFVCQRLDWKPKVLLRMYVVLWVFFSLYIFLLID